MENGYQIISSKEEYDTLVKKLASEMIKIPERTSVFQDAPKSSGRKDLLPFIEHIDYCYYRSIMLLINSLKANKRLSDDAFDAATKLCKDILFCESFKEYLLISSLYTTRYLLCSSYMRLDSYVYYSTHLEKNESFLQSDILRRHTEKEHRYGLTVHSPIHDSFKIDDEKNDENHAIKYDQDYTDAINAIKNCYKSRQPYKTKRDCQCYRCRKKGTPECVFSECEVYSNV